MSYQVLARKWRPKSFATLVGQEHVVRALTHALDQQRLHHAYLFANQRGTRMKVLVHDGQGLWLLARRLHQGRFVWPHGDLAQHVELNQAQWQALIMGLPWQRLQADGAIRVV